MARFLPLTVYNPTVISGGGRIRYWVGSEKQLTLIQRSLAVALIILLNVRHQIHPRESRHRKDGSSKEAYQGRS